MDSLHQIAFKIASFQAGIGCLYNVLINHYVDPERTMCNPPGLLTALTGVGVSSSNRRKGPSPLLISRNSVRSSSLRKCENSNLSSPLYLRFSSPFICIDTFVPIADEQQLQFDWNSLLLGLFVIVTCVSLQRWVGQAAIQMNVATTPLFLALFLTLSAEIIGRGQRCEHLKGAEAVARWTWIVFPCSIVTLLTCGVHGASFFYLVILLRCTLDLYRTMYRYWTMDPTIHDSLAFRGTFHLVFGWFVIPTVLLLSSVVSVH